MGENYIYSNILGVFVLDDSFKLLEKIDIKGEKDFSVWFDEEKKAVEKYKKNDLFYLGYKTDKLEGIKTTQDPKKLAGLIGFVRDYKEKLRLENIQLTKERVREAVIKDSFIVQTINNIEEINKASNLLVKRLREWYELYLPEFSRSIENHEMFVDLILKRDKEKLLQELGIEADNSMGADIESIDVKPIMNLAESIKKLYELRDKHEQYLDSLMKELCPNIQELAGTLIAAKLIAHARSVMHLAKLPASTVQLLGAEKALFRHLKTGSKPPKYGVLFQHSLLNKVKKSEQGKAARVLADKISIAVRVDAFKGKFIGDKLKIEVEEMFFGKK